MRSKSLHSTGGRWSLQNDSGGPPEMTYKMNSALVDIPQVSEGDQDFASAVLIMAINRRLLPIKAHFFFNLGGAAPVFPFITLMIKELGFSATVTGAINTVVPVVCMVAKPFVGAVADKFKIHKYLLIFLILSSAAAMMSLRLLTPLPMQSTVELQCDSRSTRVLIKTTKASDECFMKSLSNSLYNTQMECQFIVTHHEGSFIDALTYNQTMDDFNSEVSHLGDRLTSPTYINLFNPHKQEENTIVIHVNRLVKSYHTWIAPSCGNATKTTSGSLHCPSPLLHEIVNEVKIPDDEVVKYRAFWYLLIIVLLVRVIGTCCENLTDSVCFKLLKGNAHNYGLQRMWGSAGWGLMSAISGYLVDKMSAGKAYSDRTIAFYLSAGLAVADAAICLTFKVKDGVYTKKTENIWSNVGKLLRKNPKFIVFLVLVVSCGIFSSLLWNFLFWFIVEIAKEDGCRDNSRIQTLNGLVMAVNCYLGEMPFFFLSGWFLKKIGYEHCMTLVLVAFGVRFIFYYFLTNPWLILPIEVLNGLTFGLFYSTMTTYANALTPPGLEGTMQGLVSATFEGIGLSFGSLLGGYLFDRIGGRALFLYGGSISFFLAAAHCILLLTWMTPGDQQADADEDSDEYHVQDIRILPEQHNHEEEWE